jgi:hypothetical protein
MASSSIGAPPCPCPNKSTLAASNAAGFASFLACTVLYRKEGR